jgi:hypothetical protein
VARAPPAKDPHPLRDAALILAGVSAVAYLLGFLYVSGYYTRLGIHETELRLDSVYLRSQIVSVLLYPVGWLGMIAAFGLLLAPRSGDWKDLARPFYPVPAIRIAAIVYSIWAVKLLGEITYGRDSATFVIWNRRDVVFFLIGLALVILQYLRSWHVAHRLLGNWVTSRTRFQLVLFLTLSILAAIVWPAGDSSASQIGVVILLVLGWIVVALDVIADIRKRRDRSPEGPPEKARTASAAEILMLGVWVVLLLLLTAGLAGSVDAGRAAAGCQARKTVEFEPLPPQLHSNHTYWLILHQDSTYYVRDITQNGTVRNYIVSQQPNMTAALGVIPGRDCLS